MATPDTDKLRRLAEAAGSGTNAAFMAALDPATVLALCDAADHERWRPIETAPKDETNVLIRYRSSPMPDIRHYFIIEAWWCVSEWQTADGCYSLNGEAVQWMPLPPSPEEK